METATSRAPFFKVSCPDCGKSQVVFSRVSTTVACHTCGTTLAEPRGGRAKISGDIVETLQ